ncbi:hypothetical protein EDD22DRAFT_887162 [Suillus occidentalis]|nr:hypothetical protein EDD22DRAFT_887162 [Suillus occidentalis]
MLTYAVLALTLVILGYADALPSKMHNSTSCDLSHARLKVPANQTQLIAPTYAPSFIGIGVGTQNYTCNATKSTYSLIGAVAELFDSSCLYGSPAFESAPTTLYDVGTFTSSGATAGNTNAYVIGVKIGDLPSSDSNDIDDLMIKAVEGELASEVFRVETNGAGDSNITIKYTAQYWFFQ